jgi:hypothetical protein
MQKINKSLKIDNEQPTRRRTEIKSAPVDFETIKKRSILQEELRNLPHLTTEEQTALINRFKDIYLSINSNV